MVSLYSKLTKTQKVMLNHSALDKLLKITFFTFRPLMILQVDQNLKSQAIVIVPWTIMKIIFFVFISFLFLKTISVFKRKKYSPILLNQKYVYRRTSRFLMTARQGNFFSLGERLRYIDTHSKYRSLWKCLSQGIF